MIKTTAMLLEELREYGSPKSKLARMAERGECFPITRGLYETDRNAPAYLLAGSIYGPSYISFEYALSRYGLIPEAVYAVTCATFEKKKKKKYETPFGTFTYRDVPSEAFPLGIRLVQEGDYFYRIAEPEKALCDKVLLARNLQARSRGAMQAFLLEDLRVDEEALAGLDVSVVAQYAQSGHKARQMQALMQVLEAAQ